MLVALLIIGPIVLIFLILVLTTRKLRDIHIRKTTTIHADLKSVFEQVLYLDNFPKWSPFLEVDPDQTIKVKGTDGQVGAQYHWEGNKGKDLGFQEIKKIEHLRYIKMECSIQKPFEAQPTFEYSFQENQNSVTVIQDFSLKSGAVSALFMGIFGAKKQMEKMNARGLELLQGSLEK